MRLLLIIVVVIFSKSSLCEATNLSRNSREVKGNGRKGKVFSLFNIVQFKNDGCTSSQVGTGMGNRLGTCYTSSECISRMGGRASGSCAAGFGVCCVFTFTADSSVISENCSYIQNPGFPTALMTGTTATTLTYKVNREDNSICTLRLDFDTLSLLGTDVGGTCLDKLDITLTNSPPTIPEICGTNSGQHMYLDIGSKNGNMATLTFTLAAGSTTGRLWDIKVTQIPCGSPAAPPENCLQYFTGRTGTFTTFNYAGRLLKGQHYTSCIRQEEGFCCIQYTPCITTGTAMPFSLPAVIDTKAYHDFAGCVPASGLKTMVAYLGIPGSSGSCTRPTNEPLYSAFCGTKLSVVTGAVTPSPVCDCTPPFLLEVTVGSAVPTTATNGVCLTWMQQPCT